MDVLQNLDQILDLLGNGIRSADAAAGAAQRIKSLLGDPKAASDEELRGLAIDLASQIADTKLANAELKIQMAQLREALYAQQQRDQKLALYAPYETGHGATVLALQNDADAEKHFRLICPNCVGEDRIIPLQPYGASQTHCPRCHTVFNLGEDAGPRPPYRPRKIL